ncbi:MAG: hypothetical protein WCM93_16065 [Bacteroidota bacterium]
MQKTPKHFGLAHDSFVRIADACAHDVAYGRPQVAVIWQNLDAQIFVIDLKEYFRVHPYPALHGTEGYLVVTYSISIVSGKGVAYAHVDGHYIYRESAYQRFLKLLMVK